MMKKHLYSIAAAAMAVTSTSFAGVAVADGKEAKQPVEQVKESWITGDLGMDVYSKYIFHGIVQENQGVIMQPYADIYMKFYQGDGFLNSITLNLSIWNSFHTRNTVASTTNGWYEFDFDPSISIGFAKNFTFTFGDNIYTSPGDYFSMSHNLMFKLAYNDADLFGGKFAFNPYVFVERPVSGLAGNGTSAGLYYEVGITPTKSFGPVSVSVPVKAGFGSGGYYAGNAGFGYFSAGLALGYTLPMPEKLGVWSVSTGATFYQYGPGTNDANSVRAGNQQDVVFNGGFKVAF
jgi:hypothetical protein